MENTQKKLIQRVAALYNRFQQQALLSDDLLQPDKVQFPNYADIIQNYYEDRKLFRQSFNDFIPAFSVFRAFQDPSSIVLDVGAHYGYSAIAMREEGYKSKIISIDPFPANIKCLERIKKLEGSLYDFIEIAIANSSGTLPLYIPVINGIAITALASSGQALSEQFASHFANQSNFYKPERPDEDNALHLTRMDISCNTLDSIFAQRGELERIVAIKMDLEGHEGPALEGCKNILYNSKPLIMVEGANRNEMVKNIMIVAGYFHCERNRGILQAHSEQSLAQDGYWVHHDRANEYRTYGLLA